MADINYNDYGIAAALGQLAQAQEAQAMRPQKSSVFTRTTGTSTPRALEDMIMRRNLIGVNNQRLLDALKGRETAGYGISNALSQLAPVQGYGDWGANALRTLGAGIKGYTDSAIAREQVAQELAQKDLETALAFDKAMGETQTQTQDQTIGYTPMEYGTAGGKGSGQGGPDQIVKNIATATGEGMDPEEFIKQYNTGGFIESGASDVDARDNPTLAARFIRSVVAPINTGARSALSQNMTDKIIGPKIQNMIQNMGGARGADTLREVSTRIGPLAQITSLGTQEQLGAISAAKTDVLDIINRDRAAVGMQPLTMEQFQPAWNKLFTGIATYHKQYGENKSSKAEKQMTQDTTPAKQYDYSKYGF